MKNNTIPYYAQSISDVVYHLKNTPNLQIVGGCTGLAYYQSGYVLNLPEAILSIRNVPELQQITKNERFLEFGSAVSLSQIEEIESKKIPKILHDAIACIANPAVKNMATIGGNICSPDFKMTSFAPLLAMDTKLEFKNYDETIVFPIGKFTGVPPGYFLSKIRVPLEEWDISVFYRVGDTRRITPLSASFVFLANTQKNMLSDMRIAFCGPIMFRNRELENLLIGTSLPISEKTAQFFFEQAEKHFMTSIDPAKTPYNPILKAQFINLLKKSLEDIVQVATK